MEIYFKYSLRNLLVHDVKLLRIVEIYYKGGM